MENGKTLAAYGDVSSISDSPVPFTIASVLKLVRYCWQDQEARYESGLIEHRPACPSSFCCRSIGLPATDKSSYRAPVGGHDSKSYVAVCSRLSESNGSYTSGRAAPVTFPKELLHPRIIERAWPAYMRTDFDNAAFEAMKAVEIAVRDSAAYGPEKIGVNLIQDAFSQGKGPLADAAAPSSEQVSRMNLFWGAIGCYKTPQSHRDVNLNDPIEALEII